MAKLRTLLCAFHNPSHICHGTSLFMYAASCRAGDVASLQAQAEPISSLGWSRREKVCHGDGEKRTPQCSLWRCIIVFSITF